MTKKNKGGRPRGKFPYTRGVKLPFIDENEYDLFMAITNGVSRLRVEAVLSGLSRCGIPLRQHNNVDCPFCTGSDELEIAMGGDK